MLTEPSFPKCLTIITVTLNDPDGLKKTLENVAQLLAKDATIEHVIIDGASSYDVGALVSEMSPKSLLVSEPDEGIYDAMNKGVKLAKGRYFNFINSGDLFIWERLFDAVPLFEEKYDFIYGDAHEIDADCCLFKKANHHSCVAGGMFTHHQAMLFNRRFVVSAGLKHDVQLRIAGDWDFVIKFMKLKPRVLYLPISLCIFNDGGISKRHIEMSRDEVLAVRLAHFGERSAKWRRFVQDSASFLRRLSPRTYFFFRQAYVNLQHKYNG